MAALAGVTVIRFALAGGLLGAAIAAGASRQAGLLGFFLGIAGGAIFVLADPRRKLFAAARPQPRVEEWWRGALRATYPSTLGLTVLGAVSLAFSPVLAAVLAGVIGGLGVAGALSAAIVLLDRG